MDTFLVTLKSLVLLPLISIYSALNVKENLLPIVSTGVGTLPSFFNNILLAQYLTTNLVSVALFDCVITLEEQRERTEDIEDQLDELIEETAGLVEPTPICSNFYTRVGDTCYKPVFTLSTRDNAQTACTGDGGHLANPETTSEATLLVQYAQNCLNLPTVQSQETQTQSSIGCEGTSLTITCPSGSRVHIQEANYGRTGPSSDDPCGRPEDSNQNCREPDSLSIVRNECEGQQTCTVAVNSGTFGGDPCPGTFKYLQVEYICSQRTIICETNTGTITCPSGEKITILYANYGRTAPQSVDLCNDPRDTNKDCRAATSEATVKAACDGQSTCTLTPTNTLFGDPCGGTYKYLEILYVCSGQAFWICPTDRMTDGTFLCESSTVQTSEVPFVGSNPDGGATENCVAMVQDDSFNPGDKACDRNFFYMCEKAPQVV